MEFDPYIYPSADELQASEFDARYEALLALIEEAESAGDENRLDIYEEALHGLELENPRAYERMKKVELQALSRDERREHLKKVSKRNSKKGLGKKARSTKKSKSVPSSITVAIDPNSTEYTVDDETARQHMRKISRAAVAELIANDLTESIRRSSIETQ